MQRIKPYSTKRGKQVREYKKIRIQYLRNNPLCEVCGGLATTIHHKKGRIGELLTNTKYFLPACMRCHDKIEINPEWAREKGYSLNRLS